jgi:hypothetical protein
MNSCSGVPASYFIFLGDHGAELRHRRSFNSDTRRLFNDVLALPAEIGFAACTARKFYYLSIYLCRNPGIYSQQSYSCGVSTRYTRWLTPSQPLSCHK